MIALAILLQVAGAHGASVGDTIWVARTVQVAPQHTVRPAEWEPADPVEVVGPPQVLVRGTTVEIRYPITVWRAGLHPVAIPGPLVLGPDGSADSLPAETVTLDIKSMLPPGPADSPIAPQPRAEIVPRRMTSPVPLVILLVIAALPLLALRRFWWRRGPSAASPPLDVPVPAVPVERWADAGERRAVASLAAARLRATLDRRGAGLPPHLADESHELLDALDRTRFGSTTDGDALTLYRRAVQLEERIGPGAP